MGNGIQNQSRRRSFARGRRKALRLCIGVAGSLWLVEASARTAQAGFINVVSAASGSAQYSVQSLPNQSYATAGPSTLSAPNTSVLLGSFSSIYANTSTTFTATNNSLSGTAACGTGFPFPPNFHDLISSANATLTVTFQVNQTGMYSVSGSTPYSGTSYGLKHESSSINLVGLIGGNSVTLEHSSNGGSVYNPAGDNFPGAPNPIQLSAGIPYTLTLQATSDISDFKPGADTTGGNSSFTLTAIPEPGTVALLGGALLILSGRRGSRSGETAIDRTWPTPRDCGGQ